MPGAEEVFAYLRGLQDGICSRLEGIDGGEAGFREDAWIREGGGGGMSRVLEEGAAIEKAGVNLSRVTGGQLPPAASVRRPELAGRAFEAMGVSVIVHPLNPYAPTSHLNVRFFIATDPAGASGPVWWFGGGFDLTPFYGCEPFGSGLYPRFKKWCDEYFHLKHRGEPRGIGGLFFDDFDKGGFDNAFAFARSVGDHYMKAYGPILERRRGTSFGRRERDFQLYRRGRYVEFNLLHDRGTLFGLQSGGRVESILVSMPPKVCWRYDWRPEPGSPEARLYEEFLRPRDWAGGLPEA